MYQDSKHKCRTIVLIKPFVWGRSCRCCHRGLLKLPKENTTAGEQNKELSSGRCPRLRPQRLLQTAKF